jgi:hypothetical protein
VSNTLTDKDNEKFFEENESSTAMIETAIITVFVRRCIKDLERKNKKHEAG